MAWLMVLLPLKMGLVVVVLVVVVVRRVVSVMGVALLVASGRISNCCAAGPR